jgi:integrase
MALRDKCVTNYTGFMARISENDRKGPIEVVESKGIKIPIYSSPYRGTKSYLLAYYTDGARKRERAPTLEAGRKRAKELIDELADGVAHVGTFTPKQAASVNEAVSILQPTRVPLTEAARQFAEAYTLLEGKGTLYEAVKFFLAEQKKAQLPPIKFGALVKQFLENIEEEKKSRRYRLDMQARLNKAKETFSCNVADLQATDINAWLKAMKHTSGRTKNNYRSALATVLAYAREEGYLPRGVQTEAEFSKRYDGKGGDIGIYTPEKIRTLLFNIEPRLVPFVAIGAFSGLRSAEIVRLEWPEIRFGQNVIEIKASKSKTASRRLAPILPVLAEWLAPFRRESGKVLVGVLDEFAIATQFKKAVDAIIDEKKQPLIKIVHNGLRHSFITYRMAILKSAAEVALEAGNSPRMIFEHYRELATAEEANEWFGVKPSAERLNVIETHGQVQPK